MAGRNSHCSTFTFDCPVRARPRVLHALGNGLREHVRYRSALHEKYRLRQWGSRVPMLHRIRRPNHYTCKIFVGLGIPYGNMFGTSQFCGLGCPARASQPGTLHGQRLRSQPRPPSCCECRPQDARTSAFGLSLPCALCLTQTGFTESGCATNCNSIINTHFSNCTHCHPGRSSCSPMIVQVDGSGCDASQSSSRITAPSSAANQSSCRFWPHPSGHSSYPRAARTHHAVRGGHRRLTARTLAQK